jgi:non-lysosomal glucosylceramidase
MIYRDYVLTGRKDTAFLRETWPAVKEAIAYLRQFDHGGGVPENSGYPDQTYDSWVVRGVSAYSGGLWLAALRAGEETARTLGDKTTQDMYHQLFHKAQQTYISKLWNGDYFRYDTESENQNAIQADQLAGQWYANMLGLGDLVPHEMQVSAAKKIFEVNVMKFAGGQMGAANGMNADGSPIDNVQAKEVWAGTTLGFAALLLSEDMKDEAYKSAWGLYHVIYETKGYWFRTPEAWDVTGNFRAGMYMRPAGVWAMEMMPDRHPPTRCTKCQTTPRIHPSISAIFRSLFSKKNSKNPPRYPSMSARRNHAAIEYASCWCPSRSSCGYDLLHRAGYTSATADRAAGICHPSNGQKCAPVCNRI